MWSLLLLQYLTSARLAKRWESPVVGTPVVLASAPVVLPSMPTVGIVAITQFTVNREVYMVITAPAAVASSGGGVYAYGKLVGIATGLFHYINQLLGANVPVKHGISNLVTAVPLEAIREFLADVKKSLEEEASE